MALAGSEFLLNGFPIKSWDELRELVNINTRHSIVYDAVDKAHPNKLGLFGLFPTPEVKASRTKKEALQFDLLGRGLAERVKANAVYRSIVGDPNFLRACAAFHRLKRSGRAGYRDPFSELRFVECFALNLQYFYLLKLPGKPKRLASAKTRTSARAAAQKLARMFEQDGLTLSNWSEQAALKRGLGLLISEVDGGIKPPRQDRWTTERVQLQEFARSYQSCFGHVSTSIARRFAGMIKYEVDDETIKGNLKGIASRTQFSPETVFYDGGVKSIEFLPFSPLVLLPTK